MHTPHPGPGGPEDGQEYLWAKLLTERNDLSVSARVENEGGDLHPVPLERRKQRKGQSLAGGELLLEVGDSGGEGREKGRALSTKEMGSIPRDHPTPW